MPAKSKAQYKFMEAAAHNPKFAKKAGIKPSQAKEIADSTKNPKKLPARAKKK
jgi:hypothetical protein